MWKVRELKLYPPFTLYPTHKGREEQGTSQLGTGGISLIPLMDSSLGGQCIAITASVCAAHPSWRVAGQFDYCLYTL